MVEIDVDVCVVGAGFAGLSCARALERRGRRVCVLEARERVGGRVLTLDRGDGTWVDVGGQWVGPTQDRLYGLARELGVETFPTHTEGKNLLYVRGRRGKSYTGTIPLPVGPLGLVGIAWLLARANRLARTIPVDRPWDAPRARELDGQTLAEYLDRAPITKTARRLVEVAFENVFACDADEISLLFALAYARSAGSIERLIDVRGGAQQDRFVGGALEVATRLAAELASRPVHDCPVTAITQSERGVVVRGDRAVVRAKRAVVALPPRLAAEIAYDPAPSAARSRLWEAFVMGRVIKCTAVYDRPFWRSRGLSGQAVSDDGLVNVTFDNSVPGAPVGMLTGFIEGRRAVEWAERPEAERRAAVLDCFARYFGAEARHPLEYVDKVWAHERWSGGCYVAYMPPRRLTEVGPELRAPHGRVHWAGTETAMVWNGYIDGALESGERAAAECASE